MTPPPHTAVYYRSAVARLYRRSRRLKLAALACSLALITLFVILKLGFDDFYSQVIQEDGPLENAQAAAYLAASVVSFSVMTAFARRRHALHAVYFVAIAAALIFVCLEEVSWGQRVLDLPTPGYFRAHNTQSELTLHNLGWINTHLHRLYILCGLLCSFGWLAVRRRTGLLGGVRAALLVPGWYLMFYFLPVAAVNIFFELGRRADALGFRPDYLRVGYFVVWRDQEPAELLLSLGLLLFVISIRLRQDAEAMSLATRGSHPRVWAKGSARGRD